MGTQRPGGDLVIRKYTQLPLEYVEIRHLRMQIVLHFEVDEHLNNVLVDLDCTLGTLHSAADVICGNCRPNSCRLNKNVLICDFSQKILYC